MNRDHAPEPRNAFGYPIPANPSEDRPLLIEMYDRPSSLGTGLLVAAVLALLALVLFVPWPQWIWALGY